MIDKMARHILNDSSLKSYALRLSGNKTDAEDAISELAYVVCELEPKKREAIQDYFNFWCVRTLRNLTLDMKRGRGKMSKYYQHQLNSEDLLMSQFTDHREEDFERIKEALSKLYWYDREMLLTYIEEGSCRAVEELTGISYTSVALTVKDVKEKLQWALSD